MLVHLVYCLLLFYHPVTGQYISVTNDGPVTIDTPITFTVFNYYSTIAPRFEYRFKFSEFPEKDTIIISTLDRIQHTVIFNKPNNATNKDLCVVQVDVWYRFVWTPVYSIGTVVSTFSLSEFLLGQIFVEQSIPPTSIAANFISTESPVNMTAKLHDPSNFFSSASITYKWIINGLAEEESSDYKISSNFTKPQINNITVIVSAVLNISASSSSLLTENAGLTMQKNGSFDIVLTSRDPIHDLTADGHTNVELFRDESLQLTMKIDGGSPPFGYCWKIVDAPENETLMLDYCTNTNESFFMITRYFDAKGKKNLLTRVFNDVSSVSKNLSILIYEIEHSAQLSFILIPVCSIILAIFIIIAGIAIHMRQRKELSIEVADFDFQSVDEMIERTFFERIRDNFTQSLKFSIFRSCGRGGSGINGDGSSIEYEDFMDKNDSDEIAPNEPNISECNLRFSGDLNDSGVSTDIRS